MNFISVKRVAAGDVKSQFVSVFEDQRSDLMWCEKVAAENDKSRRRQPPRPKERKEKEGERPRQRSRGQEWEREREREREDVKM